MFPTWAARDNLLEYCSALAERPVEESSAPGSPAMKVSERLDPYARRQKEVWEKHDELRKVIRQERGVEEVIRLRTWELVVRRCQLESLLSDSKWNEAMAMWKEQKG